MATKTLARTFSWYPLLAGVCIFLNIVPILDIPSLTKCTGHIRPLCHLALRMLECNSQCVITIFFAPYTLAKAQAEIADHLPEAGVPASRIRVVTIFDGSVLEPMKIFDSFIAYYPAAYKTLHDCQRITCATTGVAYDAVSAPVAVIIDVFLAPVLHATRKLTGKTVPIIAVVTGSAAQIIRTWGPERFGGRGNFVARVEAEAQRTGEDVNVLGVKMYRETTGKVISLPGFPPMYDHEFFPQDVKLPLTPVQFMVIESGHEFFDSCDGVLLSSPQALEMETINGVKEWLSETGKAAYNVGPLLPHSYWDATQSDQGAADIANFLKNMQEIYGDKSVLLVSFGSYFWPPVQEYIEELILTLIEKKFPFILCHPAPAAKITPELFEKITSSGIGITSAWIPQHFVLTHPATGWFLTHTGQGSITEALGRGIPLICWPLKGDQPAGAAVLSHSLRVAFELVEVRTGQGLKPIHRLGGRTPEGTRAAVGRECREIIDRARGAAGAEVRFNAERVRDALRDAWKEGGSAVSELRAFLEKAGRY